MQEQKVENLVPSESGYSSLILEKLPGYFLIVSLMLAFGALLYTVNDFLTPIFLAVVFAIVFEPMHRRISRSFGGWKKSAALLSCFVVVCVIVLPISIFLLLLASEAFDIYTAISADVSVGKYDNYFFWNDGGFFHDQFQILKDQIRPIVDLDAMDVSASVLGLIQSLSEFLVDQVKFLSAKFFWFLLGLVVMLFSLFYFLKDGKMIVKKLKYWKQF